MNFAKKLVGNEDERAVSPVIGVILMVAITVILAAVIAAFVMDIGPGDSGPTGNAQVDSVDNESVELSITDGADADEVVIIQDSDGTAALDSQEANTGATVTFTGLDENTDYTVYLLEGDLSADQPLDDADGHASVGTFTTDETP